MVRNDHTHSHTHTIRWCCYYWYLLINQATNQSIYQSINQYTNENDFIWIVFVNEKGSWKRRNEKKWKKWKEGRLFSFLIQAKKKKKNMRDRSYLLFLITHMGGKMKRLFYVAATNTREVAMIKRVYPRAVASYNCTLSSGCTYMW